MSIIASEDVIVDPVLDEGHVYRTPDGQRAISVTQVLRDHGYGEEARKILGSRWEEGARRGTAVHKATAQLDMRQFGGHPHISLTHEIQGYIESYRKFCIAADWRPLHVEKPLIVRFGSIWCGLTIDRIGLCGTAPVILDVKTSAAASPWWGLQLAPYEEGAKRLLRMPGPPVDGFPFGWKRKTVRLCADGTYPKVDQWDDPTDFAVFCSMLQATVWKVNKGLRRY